MSPAWRDWPAGRHGEQLTLGEILIVFPDFKQTVQMHATFASLEREIANRAKDWTGEYGIQLKRLIRDGCDRMRTVYEPLGMTYSCKGLSHLCALLDGSPTADDTRRMMEEVRRRVEDELDEPTFLRLSPREAHLYIHSTEGWAVMLAAFPGAERDIEGANKALALNLYTATVFHCMRVLERGLHALARALGIPYAPSWESYLKQIDTMIAMDWRDKPPTWKQNEEFFAASASHLRSIKTAWRNSTMHVKGNYNDREALEVMTATMLFMGHLSTRLNENEE